jgi:alpha-tubulin suppressor-like RCC1 family protein
MVRKLLEMRAIVSLRQVGCFGCVAMLLAVSACQHGGATPDKAQDMKPECDPSTGCQTEWKQLTLSNRVACALAENGGVWCWGERGTEPQRVAIDEPVQALASSTTMICALTEADTICWASQHYDDASRLLAGVLPDSANLEAMSAEHLLACGVVGEEVRCWGEFLDLDDNSRAVEISYSELSRLPEAKRTVHSFERPVAAISVGGFHACALDDAGQAFCWGRNRDGQLGDGTTDDHLEPAAVDSDRRFKSISAGWLHTCGVTSDQEVFCWGAKRRPAKGEGADAEKSKRKSKRYDVQVRPERVSDIQFTSVAAGRDYTCGRADDGSAQCWGANTIGQLGNGTTERSDTPTPVSTTAKFSHVAAGTRYACGVTDDADILCWGDSSEGQTGDYFAKLTKHEEGWDSTRVYGGATRVLKIDRHTQCVLTRDDEISCEHSPASLESEALTKRRAKPERRRAHRSPMPVEGTYRGFATSGAHLCLLDGRGRLACLGDNALGQSGQGSGMLFSKVMAPVAGDVHFSQISTSMGHACALSVDGDAYCWGLNRHGQAGRADDQVQWTPAKASGDAEFSQLVTGFEHTCGLTTAGEVKCWGRNDRGQLGDGTTSDSREPVSVVGGVEVAKLASTGKHTCALSEAGEVFCWGANNRRQASPAATPSVLEPVQVALPEKVSQLAVNYVTGCAATDAGEVYCWGGEFGKKPHLAYEDPSLVAIHSGLKESMCMTDEQGRFGCLADGESFRSSNFTIKPVAVEF